jgi:hypothetical protein
MVITTLSDNPTRRRRASKCLIDDVGVLRDRVP